MSRTYTEQYDVTVERDGNTNQILREVWKTKAGAICREVGPTTIVHNSKTGRIIEQRELVANPYPEDGSRYTVRTGRMKRKHVLMLEWRNAKGKLHYEGDEPALIRYDDESWETTQAYYKDGGLHRIGKPALQRIYRGKIVEEIFAEDGKKHRTDGAAVMKFSDTTGVCTYEEHCVRGKLHNPNGPAVIHRNSMTGEIIAQARFLNGEPLDGPHVAVSRELSEFIKD